MEDNVRRIDRNHGGRSRVIREVDQLQRQALRGGVLTRDGARQGYVAYAPSKAFGRVMLEVTGRLNDALRQLELSTVDYASDMDLECWQSFHRKVDEQLEAVRREMNVLIELCAYGIRGQYREGLEFVETGFVNDAGQTDDEKESEAVV